MPTKRVIKQKQKQKQKQSVTVNINLAKAKARASAKKSGSRKGGARGSVMMLPPPIYASPIDKLTPSMYGTQGQQIQQRSMEELLKNFLTNPEKQTVSAPSSTASSISSASPYRLGAMPNPSLSGLYAPSSSSSVSRISTPSGSSRSSSIPSSNATANSSTRNSLTDYGSINSASLNSLAYFPNNYSDSSLGSFSSDSLNPRTSSTSRYSTIPSSSGSSSFSADSLDANPTFTFMDYHNYLESQRPRKRTPEELEIIKERGRQRLKQMGINDVDAYLNSPNPQENAKMQINLNNIRKSKYDDFSDNASVLSDITDTSNYLNLNSLASPFSSDIPIPFQNEERTYLKAAEPDYEINEPIFSQNEAKVSQGNIYESLKTNNKSVPQSIDDYLNTDEAKQYKFTRPPKKRLPVKLQVEDDENENISSNPFPERMYNKMMGI